MQNSTCISILELEQQSVRTGFREENMTEREAKKTRAIEARELTKQKKADIMLRKLDRSITNVNVAPKRRGRPPKAQVQN